MHVCSLKDSNKRFSMTDSESISLGNILFYCYSGTGRRSFSRVLAVLKHTDNRALAQVNPLAATLPGFTAKEDGSCVVTLEPTKPPRQGTGV